MLFAGIRVAYVLPECWFISVSENSRHSLCPIFSKGVTTQISQKFKKFVFGVNCLIFWFVCGVCIPDLSIGDYFSPSYLVSGGDRPLPPWHSTFATPGFTRSPSQLPAQEQPSPSERNPVYLINELFYWVPENIIRTVSKWGRSERLAARSEWFKVLPESEVVWTPDGQKRKHRNARERNRGHLCKLASHLAYI